MGKMLTTPITKELLAMADDMAHHKALRIHGWQLNPTNNFGIYQAMNISSWSWILLQLKSF
jgi:hypothetical protein